jgi:hypothetical protein
VVVQPNYFPELGQGMDLMDHTYIDKIVNISVIRKIFVV